MHLLELKSVYFNNSYCYRPTAQNKQRGTKRRNHMKKREDQYVKAYRRQMKKADHDYYPGVYTYNFEVARVDGEEMGPF